MHRLQYITLSKVWWCTKLISSRNSRWLRLGQDGPRSKRSFCHSWSLLQSTMASLTTRPIRSSPVKALEDMLVIDDVDEHAYLILNDLLHGLLMSRVVPNIVNRLSPYSAELACIKLYKYLSLFIFTRVQCVSCVQFNYSFISNYILENFSMYKVNSRFVHLFAKNGI